MASAIASVITLGAAGGDGDTLATVPCQLFDFEAATDIERYAGES